MWLELIWWICNVLIFHQHILLIACEPLLNLMTNYLICVAGKQWEALRFTIEVSTCMVRCLIAHYCAIAGTILIFRFLTIWSCTCRSCCQRFWPTVRPFLHMGKWVVHEYQSNQETQKDYQHKEISDKKQDLCLHNEEDISSLQDGTNYYTLPFLFLCPISNIEKIFMHILVFRPFQSSSLMITSQTTSMVRRRGRFSYNTHGSILKCSWRGRRMDGQSSIGTGLKLQRPSTWMKAQYSPSASAVFQMRCISLCTVYDANFERF